MMTLDEISVGMEVANKEPPVLFWVDITWLTWPRTVNDPGGTHFCLRYLTELRKVRDV